MIKAVTLSVVVVSAVLLVVGFVVDARSAEKISRGGSTGAHHVVFDLLHEIPVKRQAPRTGYSRQRFGVPWTDDVDVEGGHNGCDTRNDILRRDLTQVVSGGGCIVRSGVLHDPYTDRDIPFDWDKGTDVLVQIDHVVPLLDAWQKGAQQWDQVKRVQFANDPLNLLAVNGMHDKEKGSRDISGWLPENKNFWCGYVTRVVEVKSKYGLWMTQAEHGQAARVLPKCSS